MSVLDTNVLIYRYFEDIAKIPHGSFHEEKIADYIESLARDYDLKYRRDEMNNIVIFKDASQGYEDHEPLMLQAHMDMVNEKNNDSHHDFENDPLELYVEDGYLHALGTTLGADDGYGVCYMLAILTDENIKHPALECIFTVQEEVGLCGAFGLDVSDLSAKRMINLDSETEGEICTSSSGGNETTIIKDLYMVENSSPVYVMEVKGLLGGHSGEAIHKGRGNANKLAARILFSLLKDGLDIRLVEITGGLKNNAIPRECSVAFASDEDIEVLCEKIQKYEEDIHHEYAQSDAGFHVDLRREECDICINPRDSEAIIQMMYLLKNGCLERSQVIEDLTILSLNMGVVRTYEDCLTIEYCLRSPLESARGQMVSELELVANIFNAYVQVSNEYPGWNYDPDSLLRKSFKEFYFNYTGTHLKEVATHGGLETGVFKGKIPALDIITMGPNMSDIHTPDERLNLESYKKTFDLFVSFIQTL